MAMIASGGDECVFRIRSPVHPASQRSVPRNGAQVFVMIDVRACLTRLEQLPTRIRVVIVQKLL